LQPDKPYMVTEFWSGWVNLLKLWRLRRLSYLFFC
jgi:hypothetical protein